MFSVGSRLRSTPARSMIQSRELPRIVASGGREVSSRRRRVAPFSLHKAGTFLSRFLAVSKRYWWFPFKEILQHSRIKGAC